jgi:hypothetical protein
MNAMALWYYLGSWSSTIDQINMDATADAILQQDNKNRNQEDDSGEEEND